MKKALLTIFALFSATTFTFAITEKADSITNRFIADEVVAVVGNNIILLSDLSEATDNLVAQYRAQGMTPKGNLQAESLETLLIQKFLAAQAVLDSLPLADGEISRMTDNALQGLIDKYGSAQEVERRFSRPIFTIRDIILRRKATEQFLSQSMQEKAQGGISVTPMEVSKYLKKINKDSLPEVPEQYIIAHIKKLPKLTDNSRMDLKEKLLDYRKRIMDGSVSFAALARMYSDDPMSAIKGGEMAPQPKEAFVGAFADALEKLKPGQISDVVETEFGFHIIQLIEKKGDNYRCRHILLQLKFTPDELTKAQIHLDSVANLIREKSITFEEACKEYSDDEKTNKDGGIAVNSQYEMYGGPRMKTKKFFREELKSTYDKIKNLKEGEITESFVEMDPEKNVEIAKIVMLVHIIPPHTANMKDDYDTLEELVKRNKQVEVFEEWIEKKIASMYIRIEEPYRSLPIKNKVWLK